MLSLYRNEKGMVLITALFFLGILLVVSTTAYLVTTTDLKIGGNYKANTQALYTAESGIAEALARLREYPSAHLRPGPARGGALFPRSGTTRRVGHRGD